MGIKIVTRNATVLGKQTCGNMLVSFSFFKQRLLHYSLIFVFRLLPVSSFPFHFIDAVTAHISNISSVITLFFLHSLRNSVHQRYLFHIKQDSMLFFIIIIISADIESHENVFFVLNDGRK